MFEWVKIICYFVLNIRANFGTFAFKWQPIILNCDIIQSKNYINLSTNTRIQGQGRSQSRFGLISIWVRPTNRSIVRGLPSLVLITLACQLGSPQFKSYARKKNCHLDQTCKMKKCYLNSKTLQFLFFVMPIWNKLSLIWGHWIFWAVGIVRRWRGRSAVWISAQQQKLFHFLISLIF